METIALRAAYDMLLKVASAPDFGAAADGGWDADQVLAHLISVDAGIASTHDSALLKRCSASRLTATTSGWLCLTTPSCPATAPLQMRTASRWIRQGGSAA